MRVSVVVTPGFSWGAARRLIASLDQLSTPTEEFETVFLSSSGAEVPDQLTALLPYRPNVRTLLVDDPDDVAAWRGELSGEFTFGLSQHDTLFPGALETLTGFAAEHELDAVAGRVVGRWAEIPAEIIDDEPELEPRTADSLIWLIRTALADRAEAGRLVPPHDARCGAVGVLPAVLRHGGNPPAGEKSTDTELSWVAGRLQLSTTVDRSASAARLVLQHSSSLDARVVTAVPRDGAVSAEIDLTTATEPGGLAAGSWVVRLELADPAGSWSLLDVGPAAVGPALIRSVGVVVPKADRLTVDIGPLANPLLATPEASAAHVTESARGSALTLELPELHWFETEGIDGQLFLDQMPVPARLEVSESGARLHTWVSGVAGDQALTIQLGPGPRQRLGLTLRIDGRGGMTVIPTPPVAAKPAAPKKPARKAKNAAKTTAATKTRRKDKRRRSRRRRPQGPVAQLRRAVPAPIEPLVRRLAKVPVLQKLYRRTTRRKRGGRSARTLES